MYPIIIKDKLMHTLTNSQLNSCEATYMCSCARGVQWRFIPKGLQIIFSNPHTSKRDCLFALKGHLKFTILRNDAIKHKLMTLWTYFTSSNSKFVLFSPTLKFASSFGSRTTALQCFAVVWPFTNCYLA